LRSFASALGPAHLISLFLYKIEQTRQAIPASYVNVRFPGGG
jgi:hypothetical protein